MADGMTRIPSFCVQCRSRCGCVAVVEDGRLSRLEPFPGHPSGEKLCPKGQAAPEFVYHPDRLLHPLRRTTPRNQPAAWKRVSWDEALDEIAARMGAIRDEHGPEQVAFSVTTPSGTNISDGYSWIERFIRAFGSPNMICSTEICNWFKDWASRYTYGTDIGTPDFANTDCVLLWGNNPAVTWLARSVEIQKARDRGARMIVVDPRPTVFARRADCWLRLKPGTDQVLALALARIMIENEGYDAGFVREWTNGPFLVRSDTGRFLRQSEIEPGGSGEILLACRQGSDALLRYDAAAGRWLDDPAEADLTAARAVDTADGSVECRSAFSIYETATSEHSMGWVETVTGVAERDIRHAAEILAEADSCAYYAWNGNSQSATATQTERALNVLYGLTGNYGRKGGNVPGAPVPFADISGQDLLSDEQRAKGFGASERPLGPPRWGWVTARDVYNAVLDADPYPVRMLFSFGGNLLSSQPDTDRAVAAMEKLEFQVHTDFFLNASARHADIVLPVATPYEREGLRNGFDASVEGMRLVQLRPPVIPPQGECRSDIDIVLALSGRLGVSAQMFDGDADKGHNHILAASGLDVAQLREHPEGITLPAEVPTRAYAVKDESGNPRGFPTPTRKMEIYSEKFLAHGYDPVPSVYPDNMPRDDDNFPVRLGSAKAVAFCHSQHRNIESLRRLLPDPIVEMPGNIAEARGIAEDDWIRVTTGTGKFVARARLVNDMEPDTVFAQHGWLVEGPDGTPYGSADPMAANMNQAVDTGRADPISGSIPLRHSYCEIEKL